MLWSVIASAATTEAVEAESGGMPQFDPGVFAPQLFWLLVTFGALYFILSRLALPRVGDILRAREERISGDLDKAEQLNREASEALESYELALANARAKAQEIAADTRAVLKAETEAKQAAAEARLGAQAAEAEANIAAARDDAMTNVQQIAADAATAVVTQLLGSSPDAAAVSEAVSAELSRRGVR